MVTRKSTDIIQLSKIRMREQLRDNLARHAEKNNRTLNAEIVERLRESVALMRTTDRNKAVVDTLVGGTHVNADLLRSIIYALQQTKPGWHRTEDGINDLTERLGEVVRKSVVSIAARYGEGDK